MADGKQTCKEYCKSLGSDYCAVDLSTSKVICEDPNGGDDDKLYDCSDEELDDGTKLSAACLAEYPDYPVALCAPCTNDYWCFAEEEAEEAIGESGKEVFGEDICESTEEYKTCAQIDEEFASQGGCVLTDGTKCQAYCEAQGSSACFINTSSGQIVCEDPNSQFKTCAQIDVEFASQGGCKLTDGTTCQAYCEAKGSDVCYINNDTGAIVCKDPSLYEVFYDCSDKTMNGSTQTYSAYCVAKYGADNGIGVCNDCSSKFWCFTASDAEMFVGKTATELGIASKVCQ